MKLKKQLSGIVLATMIIFSSCNEEKIATTETTTKEDQAAMAKATACSAPGWASQNGGTIGGGTAAETVVSNYDALKAAIQNTAVKVIKVTGTITVPAGAGGRIDFKDQTGKTIYGASGAKIVSTDQSKANSGILSLKRNNNVIIRNLIFEGPGAYDTDGWDLVIIDDCKNVWVDHCEFRDGVDGNLDIKNKSDYITITYTKFTYLKAPRPGGSGGTDDHRFSNLIGSSDGATADRGTLRVTWARCWWASGCKERMARVRFGKVHFVNNYYNSSVADKCVMAGFEANIRVESNVFQGVNNPIYFVSGTSGTAVTSVGNQFNSTSGTNAGTSTAAFTPPYSIAVLAASSVASNVSGAAGATLSGNVCNTF
jgi:pectate lyase